MNDSLRTLEERMHESWPRRAKVVCTLGPATRSYESILNLVKNGMNIARLNFSHGDHSYHRVLFENVRKASQEVGRNVAIMQDLQGPKIRIGKLSKDGIVLEVGQEYVLYPEGDSVDLGSAIPVSREIALTIADEVKPGHPILFNDGRIESTVKRVEEKKIFIEVEAGGHLTSHKGMNLPKTPLSVRAMTEKDDEDLKFGLELGVDMVAMSFVRDPSDLEEIREKIREWSPSGSHPLVLPKIERSEAIEEIESILELSDMLLIARGDMAVEIGPGQVPIVQKQLISACNEIGIPVITATQMLESMVDSPTPTRAEASDVANAVFDGTDAVMLSGETASGSYPLEALKMMNRIISKAESAPEYSKNKGAQPIPGIIVDSIEFSASRIAMHTGAVAIACLSHSGRSVRSLAKYRPLTPIVALVDNELSLRQVAGVWGVEGFLIDRIEQTDDLFVSVEEHLVENGYAEKGDLAVITAGLPTLRRGTTNTVKVHRVGAPIERANRKKPGL